MSCRAVMDPDLKIVECPMPYRERVGRSKLSVLKDGFRFLKTILNIAVSFRPFRFFGPIGLAFLLLGLVYGLPLVHHYLTTGIVELGMIYRIFAIIGFAACGLLFFGVGLLMERVVRFVHPQSRPRGPIGPLAEKLMSSKVWLAASAPLSLATVLLTAKSFLQYVTTGGISQHWIYLASGMFLGMLAAITFAFGLMGQAIDVLFWHQWNKNREPSTDARDEPVRLRRRYQLQ
jgi:hypothetical protein